MKFNLIKHFILWGFFVLPFVVTATSSPGEVKHIFLDEVGENTFEVLVELKTGRLYRMDEVSFTSSRYQLFEDIANLINEHRDFIGFDDEDVSTLVWGITPFTVDEIIDIDTDFIEGELTVILSFETGDIVRVTRTLTNRFSSSVEVTTFVTETINNIAELEGDIETTRVVVLHEEPYTGLSYFAPFIEEIIVKYDVTTKNFTVTVNFGNDEVREFDLDYKDTKEQLIQDITSIINDVYVEYEDARFETIDVLSKVNWEGVPWMIDDIESITVVDNVDESGTLEFTIRAQLSGGLVGVVTLNKVFNENQSNLNLVSVAATEVLEDNELFVHDFNVSLVYEALVRSLDEAGLQYYGIVLTQPSEDEEDISEDQEEINPPVTSDQSESEVSQAVLQLLLQLIIQHIQENNLDVDLSHVL